MEEKSEISKERPIILFNSINEDGIGDFSHFEDFVRALHKIPRFRGQKFIAFIGFDPKGKKENYDRIKERLEHLEIESYYGTYDELDQQLDDLSSRIILQLEQASQAIIISLNSRKSYVFRRCLVWMRNLDTLPKFIGEHEANLLEIGDYYYRSFGLSDRCYGLKIREKSHLRVVDAWETIRHLDTAFFEKLLTQTHSTSVHEFVANNMLFPAYFNHLAGLLHFFIFLDKCSSIDKNISIYCSGLNFEQFLEFEQCIATYDETALRNISRYSLDKWPLAFLKLKGSHVKCIEIISPSHELKYIELNPSGSKVIKIFSGYYINKLSYEAIYQLASVAGVSGDNTLELCLSLDVLPYYESTNFDMKASTLSALREITQLSQLNISTEARAMLNHFFDRYGRISEEIFDLPKMLEAWPVIVDYLKQNMNFYNQLETIMLEGIKLNASPLSIKEIKKRTQEQPNVTDYNGHFFSDEAQSKTPDDEHDLSDKHKIK